MNHEKINQVTGILDSQPKERLVLAVVDSSWKGVTYFGERYNYASYVVLIRHSWTVDNRVFETQVLIKQQGEPTQVSATIIGEVEFDSVPLALQEKLKQNAASRFKTLPPYHQHKLILAWKESLEMMVEALPLVMQKRLTNLIKKKEKKQNKSSRLLDSNFGELFDALINEIWGEK